MLNNYTPTVLSIAGFDPYGGAGIQVDTKVIHALGGYAFSVATALTAQNSTGVKDVVATPVEHFRLQLETILDDIEVNAVKIGMLLDKRLVMVVVDVIKKYRLKNIVLDTVMVSSSGKILLKTNAVDVLVTELFPLVDLITPNIPEINMLLGSDYKGNADEIVSISKGLFSLGAKTLLIKGGHSLDEKYATDYLVMPNNKALAYSSKRVKTSHTHGTGCVLSSAIATGLAKGEGLETSVGLAKDFLYNKLQTSSDIRFKYHKKIDSKKEPLL